MSTPAECSICTRAFRLVRPTAIKGAKTGPTPPPVCGVCIDRKRMVDALERMAFAQERELAIAEMMARAQATGDLFARLSAKWPNIRPGVHVALAFDLPPHASPTPLRMGDRGRIVRVIHMAVEGAPFADGQNMQTVAHVLFAGHAEGDTIPIDPGCLVQAEPPPATAPTAPAPPPPPSTPPTPRRRLRMVKR
jgi:hypothetical protein